MAQGKPGATDEEVIAATKAANAHDVSMVSLYSKGASRKHAFLIAIRE